MAAYNVGKRGEVRGKKGSVPARGKRYSKGQKEEILNYAEQHGVREAARKFDVAETTIYEWRKVIKRRGLPIGSGKVPVEVVDPKEERDRRILAMWRQHPGTAPVRSATCSSAMGSRCRWARCGT